MKIHSFSQAVALIGAASALMPVAVISAQAAPITSKSEPWPKVQILKTPWSDDLFRVADGHATPLTFAQWRALGYQAPLVVPHIAGTRYYRQPGIVANYAVLNGKTHELTREEYARAGSPLTDEVPAAIVKYRNDDQVYAVSFVGSNRENWIWRHLDGSEWAALGYPTPQTAGWIKGSVYRWNSAQPGAIWREFNGKATWMSFQDWLAAGTPQPIGKSAYPRQ